MRTSVMLDIVYASFVTLMLLIYIIIKVARKHNAKHGKKFYS
jgi:hypothetical protein